MFLESQAYPDTKTVDERISRAISNDHTAAMRAPSGNRRHKKKSSYSQDVLTICMLCQKVFKNPAFYRKHLRVHAGEKAHCHLCGKGVKKHLLPSHLQTHARQHHTCPLCPRRFTQRGHLNQHVRMQHAPSSSKKAFRCDVCDKEFPQRDRLRAHLRHHGGSSGGGECRPFSCELCGKSFNIKSSLQRHMSCHTGEKPFLCGICNRGYTRRSVLALHVQQVHENRKPFQCDACNLCFSQKGNLQAHFRRKHLHEKFGHNKKTSQQKFEKGKSVVKRPSNDNYLVYKELSKNDKLVQSESGATLHSYASKVKAIVSRGARAQASENQRIVTKYSKSTFARKKAEQGQSTSYNSMSSLDSQCSSSSCSGSDDSPKDIPEPSFPTVLDGQDVERQVSYDIKPPLERQASYDIRPLEGQVSYDIRPQLQDFDSFLETNKGWEDYMMADTDNILSSSYELNDVFGSPIKANFLSSKGTDETLGWTDDCTANPLFTAEDLDEIKEISGNIYGLVDIEGIKIEPCELDRPQASSRGVSFSAFKGHLAGSSMHT